MACSQAQLSPTGWAPPLCQASQNRLGDRHAGDRSLQELRVQQTRVWPEDDSHADSSDEWHTQAAQSEEESTAVHGERQAAGSPAPGLDSLPLHQTFMEKEVSMRWLEISSRDATF